MAKTVLFLSHDASQTGAPIFLLRFLKWFRENRQTPFRILIGRTGPTLRDFKAIAPVQMYEPCPSRIVQKLGLGKTTESKRAKHLIALRESLSQSNIGLIYANTIVTGKILDFLSFLDCPVICHVHEMDEPIKRIGAENLDLVKQHTSSYIAVSNAVKANLVNHHGISEHAIKLIYGFIPAQELSRTPTQDAKELIREELGAPPDSRLVCSVGVIDHRKGVDLYLKVAEKILLANSALPVHFIWVGGFTEIVEEMRTRIRMSPLAGRVHFVGPKRQVLPYYDAADIFLLPSREDPFPLVMLEAAVREKPIVCFEGAGGAPEFVEDDAGFVVPGLDVEVMTRRVLDLLSSPELCQRMGAAGKTKVLRNHDIGVGAPKIASVILDELSRQGSLHPKRG